MFLGFIGHSYLVQNLNVENKTVEDGLGIEIQFKTLNSEGVLLLAGQEGEMFLASYIQDGILHFKEWMYKLAVLTKFNWKHV